MSSAKPVLYSYFRSSASWRVRIVLALKGIDYDYKPVHLVKDGGEQYKPEYKKLNPMGTVPCLTVDGHTLADSMAIIEYLDETRTENPKILPEDPVLRAKVRALANVISSGTQPIQNLRVLKYVSNEENKVDKAQWAWKWINDGLTAYEKIVEPTAGRFSFGDTITLADVCLVPQMYNAKRFNVDLTQFPTINKIVANCESMEAFQKADPSAQPDCPPDA